MATKPFFKRLMQLIRLRQRADQKAAPLPEQDKAPAVSDSRFVPCGPGRASGDVPNIRSGVGRDWPWRRSSRVEEDSPCPTAAGPATIFLSYRREDSAGDARALRQTLDKHFGAQHVFLDVDSVQPGKDFALEVQRGLESSRVVLALIGKSWLSVTTSGGQRRIDAPDDFVRVEITTALARGIPVIPILLQGQRMPSTDCLPDTLKPLARRQAMELRYERWISDVSELNATLDAIVGAGSQTSRLGYVWSSRISELRKGWAFTGGVAGIAMVLILAGYLFTSSTHLAYQYSTLPFLAIAAAVSGIVHARRGAPVWIEIVIGTLISLTVLLGIFGLNYRPGETTFWPDSERDWMISRQFAVGLFGGFVLGSLMARLWRRARDGSVSS